MNNIAATIVKVATLAKSWCPNFVQAEEMRRINESIGEALRENAERNDRLRNAEARVAELEAEVKDLKPYRYLHPGTPEDLNRYREAIECALGHLSPTFESDPPSVKDATEILRRAMADLMNAEAAAIKSLLAK